MWPDWGTCEDSSNQDEDILPTPPIVTNKISNKYLCGKRGGIAFESVQRPNPSTGECPEGTKACPGKGNANLESTLCYP